MATRRPSGTAAEVFPPGEFIRDELEARGWTEADLADMLGLPAGAIAEMMAGKVAITPETARRLGAAFGADPQFWMNLETAYRPEGEPHPCPGS